MIATERLTLRPWTARDAAPFHRLCTDPLVMRTIGPLMTREASDAAIERQRGFQDRLGYCFWVVERREDRAFLGFCGLQPGAQGTPIEGAVEIGWRLASPEWGKGYAREAAAASLDWSWTNLAVDAVMAITARVNDRSWGLMERLGMKRVAGMDFDHPRVPDGDPLRPHITYRADRPA